MSHFLSPLIIEEVPVKVWENAVVQKIKTYTLLTTAYLEQENKLLLS